ncbi:related to UDP-N-acetylglucosamine pyrophosphorylase [Hanseniaspora guilliermondii]|uniref:UDP-N-acetylglucosamine diphosphorylase n=1 Tax=Hanseniaspora guilliermondii TaxID=56406 RepID=A0A1L0B1F6_9ASCO|nr:related to UDP-N-acetylglucosamine pyrophosphorylase [Hanseniaspora guilliermondii]
MSCYQKIFNDLTKENDQYSSLINKCQDALNDLQISLNSNSDSLTQSIKPLPNKNIESTINNPYLNEFESLGLDALSNNEVAIILMAGGQGTRLGSKDPKGLYDIKLEKYKSLFEIQLKSVLHLQKKIHDKYNKNIDIPFYIMTSPATYQKTHDFLNENEFFGLSKEQFKIFNQGTLPALNKSGDKFLLTKDKTFIQSPDGNGGLYKAIKDNHILEDMLQKGIKHIHMYCVDNVLVKIADPVFIGYAIKNNFKLCTKSVRKTDPSEKVGLIVSKNNSPAVIEYSEINKEMAEALDQEDSSLLQFRCANIVNHYYHISLFKDHLDSWIERLPYHIAFKKIPCYDFDTNTEIKPEQPNGIKLEQFIFDVFPFVNIDEFGCLEVSREDEFSPLKNGLDADNSNPTTCKQDFLNRSKKWIKEASIQPEDGIEEVCVYEY